LSGGNGACPERPWLLQLVREEASGNKVLESGTKCATCISKQECSPCRSPLPQMIFLCASTKYAHFPFSHLRFYQLRCGLVENFSIAPSEHAPSVLASPPLTESCNPVVAAASRAERARSPSLSAPCIQDRKGSKGCGGGS
jgi:hypothetical protein